MLSKIHRKIPKMYKRHFCGHRKLVTRISVIMENIWLRMHIYRHKHTCIYAHVWVNTVELMFGYSLFKEHFYLWRFVIVLYGVLILLLFYIVLDAFLMLIRFEGISYSNKPLNNAGLYENCVCACVCHSLVTACTYSFYFGFGLFSTTI